MKTKRAVGGVAFAALAAVAVGCGGGPEPKAPEPVAEAPRPEPPKKGPSVSQELGSIDEDATKRTFDRLQNDLAACHRQGTKRLDYLAGDVKFFLRIGQDGRVRYAYLEESNLGDRDTEKCLLGVLTAAQWPKPDGGEAEVQRGMGFDAAEGRPPAEWSADKIALVLAKQAEAATKCKQGAKATFHVTAYVVPTTGKKGAKEGKVEAVGVASPNKDGEAKADCIVDAVKEWKMPSPGSYVAKVSFIL